MKQAISTDELEAELGEQVRATRLRRNLSQQDLADTAGVALGSLRNLEKGAGATVATLVRVIRALQMQDWISSMQPAVTISPMQMLKAKHTRQRARKIRGKNGDQL